MVDHLQGDWAVVQTEQGGVIDLPRWLLPPNAAERAHVVARVFPGGGDVRRVELRLDRGTGRRARKGSRELLGRVAERDPGGDVVR